MRTAAKPTRANRTITVDFQNEATYFRLMEDGKAFLESLDLSLRHEGARLIVWHVVTRPVVPSAVSYADVREGNAPYRACGHGTHSHPTGT
jgi:hypothetical protein